MTRASAALARLPITRPLQIIELLVLAVLSEGPSHGYGLVRALTERVDGHLKIRPGNIYRILDRLTDAALLRECESPGAARGAERTRGFAITSAGRQRLQSETRFRARALAQTPEARAAIVDGLGTEP
ncbi:MAG: PadR family transcriptional regulator [Thermoanaerobaculia bacterium]|nr:PadR family transcriptional regulator [Thermoanaerobaculia bacterium]